MTKRSHTVINGVLTLTMMACSGGLALPFTIHSTCTRPLTPVDISHPTAVVGNGSASSCTESALAAAIETGGVITFHCGSSPVTIALSMTHELRNDINTTFDGGSLVTLDGTHAPGRMFWATSGAAPWYGGSSPYWRSTHTTITFQNITLANGRQLKGTPIPPRPPNSPATCSQGYETDGSGGAIMVTDIILHVIKCKFTGNQAAPLGPDVAGGAIYGVGSLGVVVQDSIFQKNSASNGGAIGTLQTELNAVNTQFLSNIGSGNGGNNNNPSSGCPLLSDGQNQVGSGGSGAAVYMDGSQDAAQQFCGDYFDTNKGGANALGGAIFRVADGAQQITSIDQSEFDGNTGVQGAAFYGHNTALKVTNSTFARNAGQSGGAIQADATTITFVNDTFLANQASVGGAIALYSNGGTVENTTFDANVASAVDPVVTGGSALTFTNNIFSNNKLSAGSESCSNTYPGNGNVSWPSTNGQPTPFSACAANTLQLNPGLQSAAFNGGNTRTMAIPTTSPANNYASGCPATDERGDARPQLCASGAYQPQ